MYHIECSIFIALSHIKCIIYIALYAPHFIQYILLNIPYSVYYMHSTNTISNALLYPLLGARGRGVTHFRRNLRASGSRELCAGNIILWFDTGVGKFYFMIWYRGREISFYGLILGQGNIILFDTGVVTILPLSHGSHIGEYCDVIVKWLAA